ncbi:MAG: hypothetical protein PXY39_08555 [archaeon]|nr:hypothetical protein [archaeon]
MSKSQRMFLTGGEPDELYLKIKGDGSLQSWTVKQDSGLLSKSETRKAW